MSARQEFIRTSIKKNIETLKSVNTIKDYKMPRKVFTATLDLKTAIMQDIISKCCELDNYSESMQLRTEAENLYYNDNNDKNNFEKRLYSTYAYAQRNL